MKFKDLKVDDKVFYSDPDNPTEFYLGLIIEKSENNLVIVWTYIDGQEYDYMGRPGDRYFDHEIDQSYWGDTSVVLSEKQLLALMLKL